ncbi:MAG: STAS domain-containing protein [Gammaproteobacteria bacterium]|nr:STAS domain-containing protein [Gammaproteobacteria bacterium]
MSERLLKYGIASYVSDNILIVPFQTDFYVEVLHALRQEILNQLYNLSELEGLIIDVSKVSLMDMSDMAVIEETLQMASVYGATGVLVGLNPMVAFALVGLGYEGNIHSALTIGQAIQQIKQVKETKLLSKEQEVFEIEVEDDVMTDDSEIDTEVFEDMHDAD